jgi:hypothetical protein
MTINLTTLFASAITSVVNGIALFVTVRYMSKIWDRLEKNGKNQSKVDD